MMLLLIIGAVCLVGYSIYSYNQIVTLRNRADNQWSQIDILLKKRSEQLPAVISATRGYAAHEKITQELAALKEDGGSQSIKISSTLQMLFSAGENYPKLQADESFQKLIAKLKDCEKEIAYARQFYNDICEKHNNYVSSFPAKVIAWLFAFKEKRFFE